jgi:hypothetical protein
MPGGTDEVVKVQGDTAVDVDADTTNVYHLLSKWRKEVETQGPEATFTIPIIRSAKQDDIYGALNIILPCPGS